MVQRKDVVARDRELLGAGNVRVPRTEAGGEKYLVSRDDLLVVALVDRLDRVGVDERGEGVEIDYFLLAECDAVAPVELSYVVFDHRDEFRPIVLTWKPKQRWNSETFTYKIHRMS